MLGWIIGAGGLLAAMFMWQQQRGRARAPALALPPSPLVSRLEPLLSAIVSVRAADREMTPLDLQLCAPAAGMLALGHGDDPGTAMWGVDRPMPHFEGGGPGRQLFVQLHWALAAVDPDDHRTLAEAGYDLARLRSALEPRGEPEAWRAQLMLSFEALEKALAQVRHNPYR